VRKSSININIITSLDKEKQVLDQIVKTLKDLKENTQIERATITTQEIEEPITLAI